MSKWLYILDYNTCNLYEEEITDEEYEGDAEELLKELKFNEDEVHYMYSPHKLNITTELLENRKR